MNGKRVAKATSDPTSLGNLLTSLSVISSEDLDRGLEFQNENPDIMLGESLVRVGLITEAELEEVLSVQHAMRSGGEARERLIASGLLAAKAQTERTISALDSLENLQLQLLAKLK